MDGLHLSTEGEKTSDEFRCSSTEYAFLLTTISCNESPGDVLSTSIIYLLHVQPLSAALLFASKLPRR